MSPAQYSDVVGIHFTWKNDFYQINRKLPVIVHALEPFETRIHFGKYALFQGIEWMEATYGKDLDRLREMIKQFEYNGLKNCYVMKWIVSGVPCGKAHSKLEKQLAVWA